MRRLHLASLQLALAFFGCAGSESATEEEGELTSVTARERKLTFEGLVYVEPTATEDVIATQARAQARTAFGALRTSGIMASDREMATINASTFKKREVRVIDPTQPTGEGTPMLEVRYTYSDDVIVANKAGDQTSYSLAVLRPDWEAAGPEFTPTMRECVAAEHEARRDARDGFLWYYFDPSRTACRKLMATEQKAIVADRARIGPGENRIPKSEAFRHHIPVTVALETTETHKGLTYPEYDRLFKGGVESNKLVVSLLVGRLEHEWVNAAKDGNYWEWLSALDTIFEQHPTFTLKETSPPEDITKLTVGERTYENLTFRNYIDWTVYERGFPRGMSESDKKALTLAAGKKLDQRWLTFQKPVKVQIGSERPRDFTIELRTYFGVEEDLAPYKHAMKTSDVFVYNGHSFLGSGPLDPANFTAADFPPSYQLWFLDGCISYNYYNEDYFPLKGGSKNLDLIVNGLEAPADYGGQAEGKLIAKLISGREPSYKTLLEAAHQTDPLRVVSGEADNKFNPQRTSVSVTSR